MIELAEQGWTAPTTARSWPADDVLERDDLGPLSRVICCLVPFAWLPTLLVFYVVRRGWRERCRRRAAWSRRCSRALIADRVMPAKWAFR